MGNWSPPAGYKQVPSALEGIDVYAPTPPEQAPQQEIVNFKCPQCGAETAYSVADGGLKCTHCGYYQPPAAKAVGTRAAEQEFTVETVNLAAHGWGVSRKELACNKCGAVTSIAADALTLTCPFCGSREVVQREEVQEVLRPRFLIPFKIDVEACKTIARQWLGSSWMTPAELQKVAVMATFSGIFLPYWTFDALTSADWKAEVGHTVTRTHHDSKGQVRTSTEIVWRWESGRAQVKIDDLVVPGTVRLSGLLLNKLRNYDLRQLTPYDPEFLAGFQAQAYDVPLEKAWDAGRQEMRERTRQACLSQASTSKVRNFSMMVDFADERWRYILLPIYLAAYRYADKTYQVIVNGETGAIAGQRPVDWNKVWLAIAAIMAPAALLGLVGLLTVLLGGVGVVIGGLGFILLVIGLVVSVIIYRQADSLDDA